MARPTLEETIAFAASKHAGVLDRGGRPYIFHPLRVMLRLHTEDQWIIAALHDVVEDCGVTLDDLRQMGYSEHIVTCIDALTKREHEEEDYDRFIDRVMLAPEDARIVKLADIEDNSDAGRLRNLDESDYARLDKYRRAKLRLQSSLP